MSTELSGDLRLSVKDFPKVEGQPKPQEPTVWTVYIQDGKLRARMHPYRKFNEGSMWDCELADPLGFCQVVDEFRRMNKK